MLKNVSKSYQLQLVRSYIVTFLCTSLRLSVNLLSNKKVIPRECKKHTAHRVASARFADFLLTGGGVPHAVLYGGGPHPVLDRGVPPSSLDGGTQGTPLSRSGMGYPTLSRPGMGTSYSDLGWGTPPSRPGMGYRHLDIGWGTPSPPPPQKWTD